MIFFGDAYAPPTRLQNMNNVYDEHGNLINSDSDDDQTFKFGNKNKSNVDYLVKRSKRSKLKEDSNASFISDSDHFNYTMELSNKINELINSSKSDNENV